MTHARAGSRRAQPWTISAPDWFTDVEELRTRFARLVGGTADDVALVPASSYGLSVVARNLTAGPGDRVLLLDQEFPSNYYTWGRFAQRTGAELLVVEREPGQSWTGAIVEAVDERVAIASVPNVHWTNGALVDLPRVAGALREAGSAFIIDAKPIAGRHATGCGSPSPRCSGGGRLQLAARTVQPRLSPRVAATLRARTDEIASRGEGLGLTAPPRMRAHRTCLASSSRLRQPDG